MSPKGVPTIQPAKSVEYQTPRDLFDEFWKEHEGFDLDPCCRSHHHTAKKIRAAGGTICIPKDGPVPPVRDTKHIKVDGLAQPWHGKVYMNPPYGNALKLWVPKAVHEVECGNAELVVALLPSKTDVKWWAEYVLTSWSLTVSATGVAQGHRRLHEVRFIKGRLKFAGEEGPARHGSVIVVWRK